MNLPQHRDMRVDYWRHDGVNPDGSCETAGSGAVRPELVKAGGVNTSGPLVSPNPEREPRRALAVGSHWRSGGRINARYHAVL